MAIWDADVDLDLDGARTRIRGAFPDLDRPRHHRALGHLDEHRRFPVDLDHRLARDRGGVRRGDQQGAGDQAGTEGDCDR